MEVLLRLQVFWDVTVCFWVSAFRCFEELCRLHLQRKVAEEVFGLFPLNMITPIASHPKSPKWWKLQYSLCLTKHFAMKTCETVKGHFQTFFALALDEKGWPNSWTACVIHEERAPCTYWVGTSFLFSMEERAIHTGKQTFSLHETLRFSWQWVPF